MSYSVCLRCKEMVGQYEKYCIECAKKYKQDKDFWRNNGYDAFQEPRREKEMCKDDLANEQRGTNEHRNNQTRN